MFNQKGFAFIPVLLWSGIILISVLVGQDAVKQGYKTVEDLYIKKVLYSNIDLSPPANPSDLLDPVKQYFSDISSKQYYKAWMFTSRKNQSMPNFPNASPTYENYVKLMTGVTNIAVKKISVQDLANHIVSAELESTYIKNGQLQRSAYKAKLELVYEDKRWKLDLATITPLDSSNNPIVEKQPSPAQLTVVQTNPTPEPTYIPIASPSPTPTDTPIIHDGSRTGKIVDYFELAAGQHISVYENELLPYTFSDGTKSYLTQGDINWYEKKYAKGLCGDYKVGTNEYSNCLSQMAASIGNPIIPSNSQAGTYSLPQNQYNSGYTYQPLPTYKPYVPYVYNTNPTTSTPTNYTSTSIPTYPSAINKPADNGFNATINDGTRAQLNPNLPGRGYTINQSNGSTWKGNCYQVAIGTYTCGN